MNNLTRVLSAIAAGAVALAACAPAATPVPTQATTVGLPDLGGRKITVAIENAYIPFNY